MAPYSKPLASNYYTTGATHVTRYPCTGCLSGWETGEYKVLGEYGCNFPDINEGNRKVFSSRVRTVAGSAATVQTCECGRCFLLNRECYAVRPQCAVTWCVLAHYGAY